MAQKTTTTSATTTTQAKRAKRETKAAGQSKQVTLYRFDLTPGGKVLRAYFIALILAQIGKLAIDAPFRLWKPVNISGHTTSGRIKADKGMYHLTAAGYNFFTDPAGRLFPDPDLQAAMLTAVTTGKAPDVLKGFKMSAIGTYTIA